MGARWHNPHMLQREGQRYYIEVGRQRVWLTNSLERWRFTFRCNCKQYHFRYCTFRHLQNHNDLFCQFCQHGTTKWTGPGKTPVPQCEVDAMLAWRQLRLDYAVACQVDLEFWHGRVDFYHMPTKLVVQIDGNSHFEGSHHIMPWEQLAMDVKCCAAAWKRGVRMLRIHHEHADMKTPMLAAVKRQCRSFVMLTHEYHAVRMRIGGQDMSFVDWVASRLDTATCSYDRESTCYVFK